jgi:hypothetical protein
MKGTIAAATVAAALWGCAYDQMAQRCTENFGYMKGTPAFGDCMERERAASQAEADRNSAALSGAAAIWSATHQQPYSNLPPGAYRMPAQGITCSQGGAFLQCW